jgi:hypothetical protein
MFGREVKLPLDLAFPPPRNAEIMDHVTYLDKLENRIEVASELARKHLLMSWDNMATYSPVSRNLPKLNINLPVLVFNPSIKKGYCPKLASLWTGPYKIKEIISDYLYRIEFGGRRGTKVIHRNNIYQPSNCENVDNP